MKKLMLLTLMTVFLGLMTQSAFALMTFTGSLSAPGGIIASEPWASEGFTISWTITQQADMTWDYHYSFRDAAGGLLDKQISHMIVAISPDATINDFWRDGGELYIDTYSPDNPSNPGMPGSLYGLKIDVGLDDYYFSSTKAPVWGDFYVKDGKLDGTDVYAFNAGFGDPDPLDPPTNGSIMNKILRPDSTSIPIPEPSTLLLLGSALALAGGYRRFRK